MASMLLIVSVALGALVMFKMWCCDLRDDMKNSLKHDEQVVPEADRDNGMVLGVIATIIGVVLAYNLILANPKSVKNAVNTATDVIINSGR